MAGIHAGWSVEIAKRLNRGVLPKRYECEPEAEHGTTVEIEVATYHDEPTGLPDFGTNRHGGVAIATQAYTAPTALATGTATFLDDDICEVRVYKDVGGLRLVAAIELVSPSNKDRPSSRRAFATKCAAYLQKGVSVVTVDVVTERAASLHDDIVERLHLADHFAWQSPTGLAAVCYRAVRENGTDRLDVWPFPLAVGSPLPVVPLWLNPVLVVPLELDPAYEELCSGLLIP